MTAFEPIGQTQWITMLAALMTPHDPAQTARALKQFVPHIGVPPEAYTRGSLDAVASFKRRMSIPAFDEVATPMRDWWRVNRPVALSLAAPAPRRRQPPDDAEKAAVGEILAAWRAERGA